VQEEQEELPLLWPQVQVMAMQMLVMMSLAWASLAPQALA